MPINFYSRDRTPEIEIFIYSSITIWKTRRLDFLFSVAFSQIIF